jgi:Predicted nucleotidyltransferases
MNLALAQPQLDAIADACRRHHVARLDVFGSVLRSDYRPGESDIDLLVEFQPLDAASLYKAYFALLNELPIGLGSRVDLVMADAVRNPYVRQTIEASRRQIYCSVIPGAYLSNIPGGGLWHSGRHPSRFDQTGL